ncbi:MAG: hypothetical protein ABIN58_06740 [candidate division WOR-3 bacterium]
MGKVAANMRLLFAHFDEVQLIQALEQQMRECRQELLNFMPGKDHVRPIQEQLASFGVFIGLQGLQETLSLPYESRVQAYSQIERKGIVGVTKGILVALSRLEDRVERQESRAVGLRYASALQDEIEGDICQVLDNAEAFLWFLAAVLLLVGLAAAAALAALLAALVGLVESIICG